jgi:hypothetical protein
MPKPIDKFVTLDYNALVTERYTIQTGENKMDTNQVCEIAKTQGFTQVKTWAGFIPLDEWKPYGKRTGHTSITFKLQGRYIREIPNTPDKFFVTGVWELA